MTSKEDFVKGALSEFFLQHSPDVSIRDVDDVVLQYMVSILEELGNSAAAEDLFDVEQFSEMMEAYLPGFQSVDSVTVSEWMFELASELDSVKHGNGTASNSNTAGNCTVRDSEQRANAASCAVNGLMQLPSMLETKCQADDHKSYLSASPLTRDSMHLDQTCYSYDGDLTCTTHTSDILVGTLSSSCPLAESVTLLSEMFPTVSASELMHWLSVTDGDLDAAVQHVLERMDGTSEPSPSTLTKNVSSAAAVSESDGSLKKKIVAKYSYVDMDDDKKNHRPLVPKSEPKKMIRYLDSQVVSVKGEKFTEVKKREDESMKNTYINLKPARQYRFH